MSKVKKRSYIEIKRAVDRKLGNKMILDRIQHGEYKLMTGESNPGHGADGMYADKVENEIKEMVEQINEEEKLDFSESDIRSKSKDLKRQVKEGRKDIRINTKDRDADKKGDVSDADEKKKKRFLF